MGTPHAQVCAAYAYSVYDVATVWPSQGAASVLGEAIPGCGPLGLRPGCSLSATPAGDWPRLAGPGNGRVEHYVVLRIPEYDDKEIPSPPL